jgi:hypothetical protein
VQCHIPLFDWSTGGAISRTICVEFKPSSLV